MVCNSLIKVATRGSETAKLAANSSILNNPPGTVSGPAVCPCDLERASDVISQKQIQGASMYTLLTVEVTLISGVYHESRYASVPEATSGKKASNT